MADFPPDGRALKEAPRAYLDAEELKPYDLAAAKVRGFRRTYPWWVRGGGRDALELEDQEQEQLNALVLEQDRANAEVVDRFMSKLRSGELIAYGIVPPLRPDSEPVRIPASHWWTLVPDFAHCTATGGDAKYETVHVYLRDEIEASTSGSPVSEHRKSDPEARQDRRRPGRPTCMPEIKLELRRRYKSGELHKKKADEVRHLAQWARERFPSIAPSERQIRKKLGKLYDELIGRKKRE